MTHPWRAGRSPVHARGKKSGKLPRPGPQGGNPERLEHQNPVVSVNMKWRTKKDWQKLLRQARQNANKQPYDPRYERGWEV